MESIRELRAICRKRHTKGISKQHWWAVLFTRRVSIYITWLIVRYTNISANQVTIWQMISSLLGIGLLCFANVWISCIGVLFLHLGYILDNVDGEIARYRKSQSINGMFLDLVNHIIISPMVIGCLAFHFYFSTGYIIYFVLGIAIITLTIPSVTSARYYAINYLIVKRQSPSYDASTYQFDIKKPLPTESVSSHSQDKIKDLIKNIRKIIGKLFSYPNDIITISILILIELITGNTIYGRVTLVYFTIYFAGNFVLDIYIHLKNKIPEREFLNYVQACVEIADKLKHL